MPWIRWNQNRITYVKRAVEFIEIQSTKAVLDLNNHIFSGT